MSRRRRDVLETHDTSYAAHFPSALSFMHGFANQQQSALYRAKFIRLPIHGNVKPHIDRGGYYGKTERYHLVVSSPEGSELCSGSERVRMFADELWSFNNKAVHSATNGGRAPRIHLVFDLGPMPESLNTPALAARFEADLSEIQRHAERREAMIVQDAVTLYLSGRESPELWHETVKNEAGALVGAVNLAAGRLGVNKAFVRAAISALEFVEQHALARHEVAQFVLDSGGVAVVAKLWRAQ